MLRKMGFLNHIFNTYQRNILEKYLVKFKHLINGKILDIGSKNRRYDYLFNGEITAIDIIPNAEYNVIKGDLTDLDFDDNSFNAVLCLEVFTYLEVDKIKKGFSEIYRVLKKEGLAIISLSYIYHENDENFRLTYQYIKDILANIGGFEYNILKVGNKFTSFYDMIRERIKRKKGKKINNILLILTCFFLYYIIKVLGLEKKVDYWPEGYFIIWRKK